MKTVNQTPIEDDLEIRILRGIAHQLDKHHPCWVCRDRAVHFRTIPGLVITTVEDGDGLHSFCASFLGPRTQTLTVEHYALDEFDHLLTFVRACRLSATGLFQG